METKKLKNITFSADKDLIHLARKKAKLKKITLNELFRVWLSEFCKPQTSSNEYYHTMKSLKGALSGNKFERDKYNER